MRAQLAVVLADSITGMRDLLAFGQSSRQQAMVTLAEDEYNRHYGRLANLAGVAEACGNLIMNMTMAAVVAAATLLIGNGRLDGVYLAALALGIESSFEAVLPMTVACRYWQESMAAAGRLFAIIDTKQTVAKTGNDLSLPTSFDLEIENLCFRYQERMPLVLDGVSFTLPPGRRLAIVGPRGREKHAGGASFAVLGL